MLRSELDTVSNDKAQKEAKIESLERWLQAANEKSWGLQREVQHLEKTLKSETAAGKSILVDFKANADIWAEREAQYKQAAIDLEEKLAGRNERLKAAQELLEAAAEELEEAEQKHAEAMEKLRQELRTQMEEKIIQMHVSTH